MDRRNAIDLNTTEEFGRDARVLLYDPHDKDWSVWMPYIFGGLTELAISWEGAVRSYQGPYTQWSENLASRLRACELTEGEYDAVEMIARHCDEKEAWCRSMKRFSKVYLAPDRWRDCKV